MLSSYQCAQKHRENVKKMLRLQSDLKIAQTASRQMAKSRNDLESKISFLESELRNTSATLLKTQQHFEVLQRQSDEVRRLAEEEAQGIRAWEKAVNEGLARWAVAVGVPFESELDSKCEVLPATAQISDATARAKFLQKLSRHHVERATAWTSRINRRDLRAEYMSNLRRGMVAWRLALRWRQLRSIRTKVNAATSLRRWHHHAMRRRTLRMAKLRLVEGRSHWIVQRTFRWWRHGLLRKRAPLRASHTLNGSRMRIRLRQDLYFWSLFAKRRKHTSVLCRHASFEVHRRRRRRLWVRWRKAYKCSCEEKAKAERLALGREEKLCVSNLQDLEEQRLRIESEVSETRAVAPFEQRAKVSDARRKISTTAMRAMAILLASARRAYLASALHRWHHRARNATLWGRLVAAESKEWVAAIDTRKRAKRMGLSLSITLHNGLMRTQCLRNLLAWRSAALASRAHRRLESYHRRSRGQSVASRIFYVWRRAARNSVPNVARQRLATLPAARSLSKTVPVVPLSLALTSFARERVRDAWSVWREKVAKMRVVALQMQVLRGEEEEQKTTCRRRSSLIKLRTRGYRCCRLQFALCRWKGLASSSRSVHRLSRLRQVIASKHFRQRKLRRTITWWHSQSGIQRALLPALRHSRSRRERRRKALVMRLWHRLMCRVQIERHKISVKEAKNVVARRFAEKEKLRLLVGEAEDAVSHKNCEEKLLVLMRSAADSLGHRNRAHKEFHAMKQELVEIRLRLSKVVECNSAIRKQLYEKEAV